MAAIRLARRWFWTEAGQIFAAQAGQQPIDLGPAGVQYYGVRAGA
jgi:hypothetical protein